MGYSMDLLPFKSILHLSDFSTCSEGGLRCAIAVARAHQAKLFVLHVVVPDMLTYMSTEPPVVSLDFQEQSARNQMQQLEKQLDGIHHETFVVRDDSVWPSVAVKLVELRSDLVVMGTHGRTGLGKLLLGSVAETILRMSPVPVMSVREKASTTVGGKFQRILLATNLRQGSTKPARYAVALARRDRSHLFLVHTCRTNTRSKINESSTLSVAEVLHQLHDLAMTFGNGNSENRSEPIVEFGDSKTKILEVANRTNADLVVIGVGETRTVLVASRLEMGTTHAVVANAGCPVLIVPEVFEGRAPRGDAAMKAN